MSKDYSDYVRQKIKKYTKDQIKFTKPDLDWLCKRNNLTIDQMKKEVLNPIHLVHAELQGAEHQGSKEERFRCYFVYSKTKGRVYILKFEEHLKIITAFPLGRLTLNKYRKRFK